MLLVSCASDEGRFSINSRGMKVPPDRLQELRQSWSPTSAAKALASRASKEDISWSLDFIATLEASGVTPCLSLDLKEVQLRELVPIKGKRPSGEPLTFTPKTYSELWVVAACGSIRSWQVFDESTDPRNPHRVVLARAA